MSSSPTGRLPTKPKFQQFPFIKTDPLLLRWGRTPGKSNFAGAAYWETIKRIEERLAADSWPLRRDIANICANWPKS